MTNDNGAATNSASGAGTVNASVDPNVQLNSSSQSSTVASSNPTAPTTGAAGFSAVVSEPSITSFTPSIVGPITSTSISPANSPSVDVDIAVRYMNSIGSAIDQDLLTAEQETGVSGSSVTDSNLSGLKEFCSSIREMIDVKYIEAAGKVARLDPTGSMNATQIMEDNIRVYNEKLRKILSDIRRASGSAATSVITEAVQPSGVGSSTQSQQSRLGYKPFLERLKPPVFSGKIEDWSEFGSVWIDLLSDHPESVQVQHLKANIPAADAKRVVGVKTMVEMWPRLEKVYGDKDLNIITVKSNLENFKPKSNQDFKKVQEVYEAIESAVTQLENLDALHYLKDDFGLMNQLVMKLPVADQR